MRIFHFLPKTLFLMIFAFRVAEAHDFPSYYFENGKTYTYKLEYGIPHKEVFTTVLEVRTEDAEDMNMPGRMTNAVSSHELAEGPYFALNMTLHSVQCRTPLKNEDADRINRVLQQHGRFDLTVSVNRHGFVSDLALKDFETNDPDVAMHNEDELIARSTVQPFAGMILQYLFPLIQQDTDGFWILRRPWSELGYAEVGARLGENSRKLQRAENCRIGSGGGSTEDDKILFWKQNTEVLELRKFGSRQDRTHTTEQLYGFSPVQGVFTSFEVRMQDQIQTPDGKSASRELYYKGVMTRNDTPEVQQSK